MCGVAGSLGAVSAIPELLDALAHRGPDQRGALVFGDLAVGATRLAINGGPASDQPLVSTSGRVVLVINGEIFNHRELRPGCNDDSDVSGLPDLWEKEGTAILERLRGPFALIVLDRRDDSLTLARDEMSVRPLFYREETHAVLASSETHALERRGGADAWDASCWDHLLAFQFWPRDRTPLHAVRPVPPGTWRRYRRGLGGLLVDTGAFAFQGGERDLASALRTAAALQGTMNKKTGISLSGGLDSSAVAGLLFGAGAPPDVAATGFFPDGRHHEDERPHARAVARALGIPLIEVAITAEAYWDAWPEVTDRLGGPLAGPGSVSQYLVARALAAEGVRVVFSGQGGDELFGGYERHRILQQIDRGLPPVPSPGYEGLVPPPGADPVAWMLFRGRALLPHLTLSRRRGVLSALDALPKPGEDRAGRTLAFENEVLLPGLLQVEDHTLAACGLEGRVPLLDPVVARLARGLSLEERSVPEDPRHLFRRLLGEALPEAARRRRDKMGFPVPLGPWITGPWRPRVAEVTRSLDLESVGFRPSIATALSSGALGFRNTWFVLAVAGYLSRRRAAPRSEEMVR